MTDNIKYNVAGNVLTITVDVSKEYGLSASKKSTIVASTGGFMAVGDGLSIGLNVIKGAKS